MVLTMHDFWMAAELVAAAVFIWLAWRLISVKKSDVISTIKMRYAKGEITKRQYKKMVKEIRY